MATFCRAALAAAVAACALLLGAVSALAYNPHNNGHHYGWYNSNGNHYGLIKHGLLPPPVPAPPPVRHNPGGTTGDNSSHGPIAGGGGSSTGEEPSFPDLPVTFPLPGVESPQVELIGSTPAAGGLDWLLLLIVPALAAVWVTAFARLADRASRRRRTAAA